MSSEPTPVSEAQAEALLSPALAVRSCREAFVQLAEGVLLNPARQEQIEERDGTSHFRLEMPSEWPGRFRSRKIVEEESDVASGRLGHRQAWIELDDLKQSRSWRFDAGHITDLRTGAAAALTLEALAPGARRLALIGTGRVAQVAARCAAHLLPLTEVRCTSRSAQRRVAFADALGTELGERLHMVASIDDCLQSVDAVITAVPTPTPILSLSHVEAIDAIVAVAGDGRTRQLAPEVLNSRPVVVDHEDQAWVSGEFRHARQTGQEADIQLARRADGAALTVPHLVAGAPISPPCIGYLTGLAVQDLCITIALQESLG